MTAKQLADTNFKKPFLDTSVLIKWYLGTTAYKTYLKTAINNKLPYINSFVKMEFMRAVLFLLVNFYEECKLPYYTSIDDVLKSWSNKFHQREVKMILLLAPEILKHCATPSTDKNIQITRLGDFIVMFADEIKEEMRMCNCEHINCKKGELQFNVGETIEEIINNFKTSFTNTEPLETNCKLKAVINSDIARIDQLKTQAAKVSDRKSEGFRELVKRIQEIKSTASFKCADCDKIGDFMVALTCPSSHAGQTLDNSFSYLGPIFKKDFTILKSEPAHIKSLAMTNTPKCSVPATTPPRP
ncbi:MAG: hypothetical protein NTZ48_04205 [Candidatus Omnitrophica bacterium]|nr:hypothetical protein [Candidatus Omnitrophota bacterium]